MSEPRQHLADMARQLRGAFDRAFALEPAGAAAPHVDLLAIRCADQGFALRLSELHSVSTERKVVPVPAPATELLGLASLRGIVAPVYDLRALLGYPPHGTPRWVALVRAPAPFAVAFDDLEQHLRLPASDVLAATPDARAKRAFAQGSIRTPAGPRPLIDLMALYATVTGRSQGPQTREEEG